MSILLHLQTANTFSLAYALVKEESACTNGGDVLVGQLSIEECSDECKNKATMFVFGRAGTSECDGLMCNCYCPINTFPNGSCVPRSLSTYNLYKINVKGNFLNCRLRSHGTGF